MASPRTIQALCLLAVALAVNAGPNPNVPNVSPSVPSPSASGGPSPSPSNWASPSSGGRASFSSSGWASPSPSPSTSPSPRTSPSANPQAASADATQTPPPSPPPTLPPPAGAPAVYGLGDFVQATTASIYTLPKGAPAITQPTSSFASSCGITTTIQSSDTVNSIIASYPTLTQQADLAALNPGTDFSKALTAGLSICVGNSSWCNTALQNGTCPSLQAPVTDCSTASVQLTPALNQALTLTPDLCTILQAADTNATTFTIGGVTSLVMVASPNSDAVNSVAYNPGHPHIGLWLASGDPSPMIMAVIPSWFPDGSPIYTYIPGDVLTWLVQSPVVSGSARRWVNQLSPSLQQQLKPYMNQRRRKLLASKLIGAETPGGGLKGATCSVVCYGR